MACNRKLALTIRLHQKTWQQIAAFCLLENLHEFLRLNCQNPKLFLAKNETHILTKQWPQLWNLHLPTYLLSSMKNEMKVNQTVNWFFWSENYTAELNTNYRIWPKIEPKLPFLAISVLKLCHFGKTRIDLIAMLVMRQNWVNFVNKRQKSW